MASVWGELKRRNVIKVAVAYAIVAWLLVQIVVAIEAPLDLPDWTDTLVIVLLAVGLVVALLLAWAYELTPQGVKRTKTVPFSESIARMTGRKLDFVIIGLLVLAVGFLFTDNYWFDSAQSFAETEVSQPAIDETPSIAVLPFADMSPDQDQEYFADGIAEELINELYRLDGLRVAGRTSSFSFKQSTDDVKTIGAALGVNWILEGGIRKSGDDLLITARLINPADGYQLWSQEYDRELTDIFEIQQDIATAVAGALGVRLGVGGVNAFRGAGTRDFEAYEAYLQGSALTGQAATRLLERATRLDPNYAAAWAQLGLISGGNAMWGALPTEAPRLLAEGFVFVERAVELDPESAEANSLLGTILYAQLDWIGGHEAHAKALSLRPDRDALSQNANLLMRTGRSAAARIQYDAGEAIEPLNGRPHPLRINVSLAQGRVDEAKAILAWDQRARFRQEAALNIAVNEGDPDAIKAALSAWPASFVGTNALYSSVLREFDSTAAVLSALRAAHADRSAQWPSKLHEISLLAAYFGDPEFALQAKAEEARNTPLRLFALWYPVMAEVRQLPGFKDLVTEINLVEYWRAYGWADLCRPLGDDDFTCS